MATANERLADAAVSHQIDELGYSNGVSRKIIALLNRVDRDIVTQLQIQLDKLPPNRFTVERLDQLLKSVYALNADAYTNISAELSRQLEYFTAYEVDYQQKLLTAVQPVSITAISPSEIYAGAMARPFQGKLLKEWMTNLEEGKAALIRDAIRKGYVESETTAQIVKRVRGTKALAYKDGILEISKRNAESVVLTAVAHTSSFAQESVFEANSDIVKGLQYTVTIDLRTSDICMSRSGNLYPLDKPRPAIPAHFRCRSRYIPIVKSFRELGIDADDLTQTTRQSLDGQIPAKMTYNDWLKKQSASRQDEVLGVTKAKLFRNSEITLDKFVSRQGHTYTLPELRKRNEEYFRQAGL
jgi:SPP1 gp7 family putative phage head morphogenesis protein